ncbi:MAG: hypothetical protein E6Q97_09160, partial [Desulfurellales bacterium]
MGTDIHSIAQVKRDGKWVTVAIGIAGDIRSYDTFAMLANVRNGRGFAGVRTSTGFPVIHEPRGLPNDLDRDEDNGVIIVDKAQLVCAWDWDGKEQPETPWPSDEARRIKYLPEDGVLWLGLGDHSFSWCTLAELRAFIENVAKKTQAHICGIVTREEYIAHKTTGKPYESWCGGLRERPSAPLDGHGIFVAGRIGVVYEEGGLPDFYTHVQTSWPVNAAEHSMLNEIEAALTL